MLAPQHSHRKQYLLGVPNLYVRVLYIGYPSHPYSSSGVLVKLRDMLLSTALSRTAGDSASMFSAEVGVSKLYIRFVFSSDFDVFASCTL